MRFLSLEYLTFLTSVAASLMYVKAIIQNLDMLLAREGAHGALVLIHPVAAGIVAHDNFTHDHDIQGEYLRGATAAISVWSQMTQCSSTATTTTMAGARVSISHTTLLAYRWHC